MQGSLAGIVFMLINTLSLACLDITAKYLKGTMSSSHIVFLYKASLFLMILPWVFKQGIKNIKSEKLYIHLIRSLFSVAGALCFFKGLHYVQMADAAALENVQYIILVVIGMLFFNEKATKTKIYAVVVGFVGAIVVVNPGLINFNGNNSIFSLLRGEYQSEGFNIYFGLILLAIGFWTMNSVSVKILGKTEKNKTQMFYLMLFATLWSAPFAFIEWESCNILGLSLPIMPQGLHSFADFNLSFKVLQYILFMALCYFVHGVAYFNSLKYDLSVVAPFRYTKLLFSGILGYLLFDEVQQIESLLGYTLIITSGLLLTRYEIRKYKRHKQQKRNNKKAVH